MYSPIQQDKYTQYTKVNIKNFLAPCSTTAIIENVFLFLFFFFFSFFYHRLICAVRDRVPPSDHKKTENKITKTTTTKTTKSQHSTNPENVIKSANFFLVVYNPIYSHLLFNILTINFYLNTTTKKRNGKIVSFQPDQYVN